MPGQNNDFYVFVVTDTRIDFCYRNDILQTFINLDDAMEYAEQEVVKKCVTDDGIRVYSKEYIHHCLETEHRCSIVPFGSIEDNEYIAVTVLKVTVPPVDRTPRRREQIVVNEVDAYKTRLEEFMDAQKTKRLGVL